MSDLPRMFPPWLDRIQIKYMNPWIKPLGGRLPGLSIIEHRGRTSGKAYEAVVTAYRRGDRLAVVLGHGMTDWAKNVLAAGEADVRMSRRRLHIVNPRIELPGGDVSALPSMARRQARNMAVFVADIS
ncbi:MAG TPA: nitroreductase family deazaflavin-dependent oxidoreductase [Mycobacterium sp.]|nr:nitroreductase family deazaflavin-dependent oxidoreductase [Mycobacterium sp.]